MCGIFSCFLKNAIDDKTISACRRQRNMMRHRGPDGEGEWIDKKKGVYIGHLRLSIIDLSAASNQPIIRDNNILAFNGEIYNYKDLRNQLKSKGLIFTSSGDAEVLLRAWEFWGEKALDYLDGMYAAIFWNGEKAYIFTDPFGEKQLYWAETKDGIFLSSELKPLADFIGDQPFLSDELIASYLALGYIAAPDTAYARIKRLPPATLMIIQNGRIVGTRQYWAPPKAEKFNSPVRPLNEKEIDLIHESLLDSLKVRLLADVPLCVFLSSGVDSSLIAALALKELGVKLKCITVSFPRGKVFNEAGPASLIAKNLGLDHQIIESQEDPNFAGPEAVLNLLGQPNDNITVLSVFQMAKAASMLRFKVGLTGMAGDEIFFGYVKHEFFYRYRYIFNLPESLRLLSGKMTRILNHPVKYLEYLRKLVAVYDWERYIATKDFPTINWLRKLPSYSSWAQNIFNDKKTPIQFFVPFFELSQVMPNSHLIALDRGSMRASLELRTPFLNRNLVETIAKFDARSFMAFGQKSVLRQILARYLPKQLMDHPKYGFFFPFDRFISGYKNNMSGIDGLPAYLIKDAWEKRNKAHGWTRLAVRLILMEEFLQKRFNNL